MQQEQKEQDITVIGIETLTDNEPFNLKQVIATDLPYYAGPYQLERIPGNLSPSARVFKLTGGDNVFVVRILDRVHHLEDTINEIQLIQTLSKQQIAPPIYHANELTGFVVMKFIKDTPVFRGSFEATQSAIVALAKKIKYLHALPLKAKPESLLPSNLQKERLKTIYQRLKIHEPFQIYLQGIEYLNQLSIFIKQDAFCHNNLHKHNVLHHDGESFIIDWETAGAGDTFLDLANFAILSRFSIEQENLFVTAYLEQKPSELELARFKIMKQISYLRYSLGLFSTVNVDKLPMEELDFDKIQIASERATAHTGNHDNDAFINSFSMLKEAFVAIRSPAMIEALRIASSGQAIPQHLSQLRLFSFSNPKTVERAQLAMRPYLQEDTEKTTMESLTGGSKQASNYKVKLNDTFMALRIFSEDTQPEQFRHETSLYQHAASLNLGPVVTFYNEELLCLATQFVETPVAGWQRTLTNTQLAQLAQQIRILHATPFTITTPQQTPTGLPLASLAAAEEIAKIPGLSSLQEMIAVYRRLLPLLKPQVLSHNSLSRDNILYNGEQFQIIDWENATLNDPLYDPAFLSCYFFLTPEQEKVLLSAYLGHEITPTEDQKFYLIKLLVLSHLAIVALTKCHDFDFITGLAQINPKQRYFSYDGKDKHLLNLQTDYSKFVIYQLLVNEIHFATTTGKFLACEKKLLTTREKKTPLSFNALPLVAQRSIFSYVPRAELASTAAVSKNWARFSFSMADDTFPEPMGIETIQPSDRPKVIAALKATFMPYKTQHRAIDAILSPTVIASITPFSAGLSPWANTCKLVINDKPYVLRLMSIEPGNTCTQLEILLMGLFSNISVSPKIHYASDKLGIIIMDYVDANPVWYRKITLEVLTQLGLIFNQMNDASFGKSKKHTHFSNQRLEQIYHRVNQICRVDHSTDPRFEPFREMLNELDHLKPLCESLTEPTICHHDFNVWNVLQRNDDQSFNAIDFEFSQSGDRLFDLGSLVVFMRLDKKAELELLTSFFGRQASQYEKSKYYLFKQYAWLHYIVMGLGICKGIDFQVTPAEMEELPPFNSFSSATVLSSPLDPHSDVGHYKLAIMFIKQAKIDSLGEEYRESLEFLSPAAAAVYSASP